MNDNIMVSILCPAYNHEKYIQKTLEGCLMQNVSFNYEIVIHDDASTDNTAEIIREYEKQYPRIIKPIYQNENQYKKPGGISRFIYPILQGKYVAYCECDDYWTDPNKLQMQVDYLEKHPDCSFSFHNAIIVHETGKLFRNKFLPEQTFKAYAWENRNKVYDAGELIALGFIPTASIVARKELVVNRRKFCEKEICGDLPLRLSLSLDGNGYYFNRKMSAYRTGNVNSASGQAMKSYDAIMKTFDGHKDILEGFNLCSNYRWDNEVQHDIKRRKLRSYMLTSNKYAIHNEGLKELMRKEARLGFKLKYYFRLKSKKTYNTLKLMRDQIFFK